MIFLRPFRPATYIKKRLRDWYFPVNFEKCLRKTFLITFPSIFRDASWWLLLRSRATVFLSGNITKSKTILPIMIHLRGCLHVKIYPGMKLVPGRNHPCLWWNVLTVCTFLSRWNFIPGWTHPCQKDTDEISSRDEKKKKRRVNTSSRDEILKWACFF